MTNIVVYGAFRNSPNAVAARFPQDRIIPITDENELERAAEAEVAFTGNNPRRSRKLLAATPGLRWYHTVSAGVENLPLAEMAERGIVLTNNSGSYDIQIAEHVMAFMHAAAKSLHRYRDNQTGRRWQDQPQRELRGATVVVYGMGSIGGEVARLAGAAGMRVVGTRRTSGPSLESVIGEADYLAITAPLTSATRGAVSREIIARMKPTSWIVNIARGAIVDEDAMIEALRERRIAGAALDVFRTEPLPPDSPLWSLENVIVTPHTSGDSPQVAERTLTLFAENVRRYKAGEPLLNRVDFGLEY